MGKVAMSSRNFFALVVFKGWSGLVILAHGLLGFGFDGYVGRWTRLWH